MLFRSRLLTFEPFIVINEGQFIVKNLSKTQYSIDNILLMLREKDVFDVSAVQVGILEANGKLTVFKKAEKSPIIVEDLQISKKSDDFAYPLIIDGMIYNEVLQQLKLDKTWLMEKLAEKSIYDVNEVFFASINEQKSLHISLKEEAPMQLPLIYH